VNSSAGRAFPAEPDMTRSSSGERRERTTGKGASGHGQVKRRSKSVCLTNPGVPFVAWSIDDEQLEGQVE